MCTMEYEPVCDIQGKKYSNKSCAACEGADPRGLFPCPEAEPPGGKPTENCTCTLDFLPVCESQNVVVGANECTAACKGYTTEQLKGCNPVAPATPSSEAEPCMCTFDYRPVCDYQGIPIAPNPCAADCLGYTSVQYQPCFKSLMQKPEAATVAGMRNVDKACVCPAIYDPVCDSLGKEVAPSACDADCSGLEGYLKCDAFSTTCPPPAGEPMPQPCIVTMEYSPQCMEGCEVGSNERDAMCKGYSKEQLAPCNPPVEPVNQIQPEVCICTEVNNNALPACRWRPQQTRGNVAANRAEGFVSAGVFPPVPPQRHSGRRQPLLGNMQRVRREVCAVPAPHRRK